MNRKPILFVLTLLASALYAGETVWAQACTASSTPCYQAKQDNPNRQYQLAMESPYACDDETRTGADAWANAGSKFNPTWNTTFYYGKRVPGTPGYQITFQPNADFYNSGANAETHYGSSVGSVTIGGKTIPVVNDADVMVNSDSWASGKFECEAAAPTSTQYDLARTIAHEFGHVAGMYHLTSSACATYQYGQPGVAFSSLCSTEKSGAVTLYGAK